LWAPSTVSRSKICPRSAGAGQLGLGSVAATAGAASNRTRKSARFIGGDFAPLLVNKLLDRLGKNR